MDQLLSFKIANIKEETPETRTYILQERSNQFHFEAGQFLTFSLMIDGEEIKRSYSISSAPHELPDIRITMKRSQSGFASNFLFENLTIGDTLCAYPPIGEFTTQNAQHAKEIFLIGAGSGITPLISILKELLYSGTDKQIYLLYGNRNTDSIIFRDELDALAEKYSGKFKLYNILSKPNIEWSGLKGRITKTFIRNFLQEKKLADAHFFLCGPPAMMIETISALKNLNIYSDQIHQEYFKVFILQNADEDEEEIKQRQVTILFEGNEYKITVRPKDNILESALEYGLEIPNSCRVGQCTSCRARLISGKINLVDQTALSEKDIEKGYCLTCVGFPLSDDIVIDYDLH